MRKQGGKRFLAVMLVVAAAMTQALSVNASTMSKAKDAKKAAESDLNKANSQIETIEKQQQALQSEIDAKDAELVNLLVNIGILEDELDSKNAQLEQVTADLAEAEQTEADQYASMKKRIQFMYERGDTAMIEALLGSENMADFLNRVEYVSEVYDYDRNLLDNYEKTRKQVEDLKAQVEDEKKELETAKDDLKQQQKQLETAMTNLRSQQANADTQIANAKNLASEYQKTITEQNKIIQQQQAEAAASRSSGGSSGGSGGTSKPNSNASVPGGNLNPPKTTNVSGSDVVNYAMQFVGKPYVWGGKDPNTGADCSGFTSYVYAHFGISIPSFSGAQRSCGQEVSYANAQAGDLICYAGHVAIYMGGGKIVHAKGTAYGIVGNDNATYKTIITVRRLL